jgi:hypothetical protein
LFDYCLRLRMPLESESKPFSLQLFLLSHLVLSSLSGLEFHVNFVPDSMFPKLLYLVYKKLFYIFHLL